MDLDNESIWNKIKLHKKILFSDYKIKLEKQSDNGRRLDIFVNGPSLLDTCDEVNKIDSDIMVVNSFAESGMAKKYNIKWQVIADPDYIYEEHEKRKNSVEEYVKKSNIKLIMPDYLYRKWNNKDFLNQYAIGVNSRSIFYLNIGKYEYKQFEKNNLAPRFQNVLVLAIYSGIQLGYKEIYIHGCDFSMIQQTHMEKGKLYNNDVHFYNLSGEEVYWDFGYMELLKHIRMALMALKELKMYAEYENVKIVNKSKNSYIEHFDFE